MERVWGRIGSSATLFEQRLRRRLSEFLGDLKAFFAHLCTLPTKQSLSLCTLPAKGTCLFSGLVEELESHVIIVLFSFAAKHITAQANATIAHENTTPSN